VFDKVTITYRGAKYEIGRGRDFYGVWAIGGPRSQPLQWWPETSEGWSAAWTRFTEVEAPGAITPVGRRTPPIASSPVFSGRVQAGESAVGRDSGPAPAGPATAVLDDRAGAAGSFAQGPPFAQGGDPLGPRTAPFSDSRTGKVGVALLAVGVALGIAGLFPAYLAGQSLSQQPAQLVPHAIYLAVWAASTVLILLGGSRLRLGALLSAGFSIVTFGLFFTDAGTAIAAGAHTGGWGLWLSLLGWLACTAGTALVFLLRTGGAEQTSDAPGRLGRRGFLSRPRGAELGPVVMLVLAGLGVAAAFAPSWDSYTLHTAAGQSQSLTAGNAFSNPGLVIAGDVAVMVALAAVVIVAALWRPIHHGALLLAGAIIPMAAQAISALVQAGEATPSTQFGISPAVAKQIGLTIGSGVTPAFWIYCGFLVALIVSCAWMLFTPREAAGTPRGAFGPVPGPASGADAYPWNPAAPDSDGIGTGTGTGTETGMVPGFEPPTSYTATAPRDGDHPTA
jgi:hypothetical protein